MKKSIYNPFLGEALKEARKAFKKNEVPVGAIIVERSSGRIICTAHNLTEKAINPLRHAEIIVLEKAFKILGVRNLDSYDLYVTLEPCTMCAGALALAGIGGIFYGAGDPKRGAVEYNIRLFTSSVCLSRPEIYSGIMEEECSSILKEFFQKIRKKHV